MYMPRLLTAPYGLARRFRRDLRGNVAVLFALLTIPLLGFVGAAVDYSRANALKSALQATLDMTALMLSKEAGSQSSSQMQKLASDYFAAQFGRRTEAKNSRVTVSYTPGNSTIVLNGTASMDTAVMRILGFDTLPISASSTTIWGTNSRLRVALVLDNTGSMADAGKMTALQTAAKNLLSKLQSAATNNGDVYVSIVPFTKDVNVGSGNYAQPWVRWDLWAAANGAARHSNWNGCVTDRDQNHDTTVAAASAGVQATLFPAEQYNPCPVALMPMTYDWTALRNLITSMTPAGNTNQAIGLAWGWLSLTPGSVLAPPAKSAGYSYADHIILLTDGLNTQDRWYADQASIDARQAILCSNVKAAGITLWTIQVNTDGDPTSTMLQQCASDASKFFLLTSASQIISTFDNISFKITKLHISR